jgi:tetratricopeptide (TPR) repeat protein
MPQRKNVKARTLVPPSHQHVRAGFARLRANRLTEAAQAFQRALCLAQGTNELDGEDFARLEHLIGQCLRELRNIGGARVHLERAVAHAEAFYGADHEVLMPIYTDLADALLALGAPADAKALCECALEIDSTASTSARTLCSLGKALEHLGNLKGAEAHYRKALALAETHHGHESDAQVLAATHLGNLLLLRGDRHGGKTYLQRAMALGSVAFRKECPKAAATMRHLEIALEGGAVVSHAMH